MSDDAPRTESRQGYSARILLRTAPDCSAAELDRQYETVRLALQDHEDELDPPVTVTLTRESPDSLTAEELGAALFTCREALVDVLGVSADDPGVTWRYAQRTTVEEAVAVEVTVP